MMKRHRICEDEGCYASNIFEQELGHINMGDISVAGDGSDVQQVRP